jgi:hypothetical protein
MKKRLLTVCAAMAAGLAMQAQIKFDPQIEVDFITDKVLVPESPLQYQILFVGGVDMVQTTSTYGNSAGQQVAKEWHDFIGFTPDTSDESLGWISINHEMVVSDDKIGDGGGMTVFRVKRDENTDTLMIVEQTLGDGRQGKFFNVDFVNHTGETGMNCGGITSTVDGRIWTAEEWFRGSNGDLADRDVSQFVIGTGTVAGQSAPAGFPGFDGDTIEKFQNFNYMTEIDPREAVAVRKQYNWGRQPFEGGVVMPDNKTVYTGADDTPGFFTKFVATNEGDFTSGKTYVYKQDAAGSKWVEIDNTDLDKMLNFKDEAVAVGATMFNRLEWVTYSPKTGKVYVAETGRDNPGSRWADEQSNGATYADHHVARATAQGTTPDNSAYWDYYGRVLEFDPSNDEIDVLVEAGPHFEESPTISNYPENHLTNPDGLGMVTVGDQDYLLICEDLNGTSYGRMPAGVTNRACELYLLDLSIESPEVEDLVRISVAPYGAEITGATSTPDGKTLLINSQHPSSSNPYPYNHSLTYALTGWDQLPTGLLEGPKFTDKAEFDVYPNPATRNVYFNKVMDVALYNITGKRVRVYRAVKQIDISSLEKGTYFLQAETGETKKLVIQ